MSHSNANNEGKAAPAGSPAAGVAPIRLASELGIESVKALHAELLEHLNDKQPVVLDAEQVERVHTAALQLFCLFCRDRRAAGRSVEFLRPSATLRNAAKLLGATTLLNLAGGRT